VAKQKLVFFAPVSNLDTFGQYAELVASLTDRFDVSVDVSGLVRKHREELTDPGDSYLEYSVNIPCLFYFVVPEKLKPHLDTAFAEENLELMAKKMAILKEHGLQGAFAGHDPIYLPASVYEAYPEWRGPRVDHPRRSRNPIWSPCLLNGEVADVYRETMAALVGRFPALRTFSFLTNDCGTGFCWAGFLYNKPNGPVACQSAGPPPHVAAFHRALIEGAHDAGVEIETFMHHIYPQQEVEACRPLLPEGAHVLPETGRGATANISAGGTYPVRYVQDVLGLLEQLEAARERKPETMLLQLGPGYRKGQADVGSVRLVLRVMRAFFDEPTGSLRERLALLEGVADELYGGTGSAAMVEAWYELRRSCEIRDVWPRATGMVLYNCLSARWLTRPLVAFPEELTPEETEYWLPDVFYGFGDEGRRNILDFHGGRAADNSTPGRDLALRDGWFARFDAALARARRAFESAAGKGVAGAEVTARALDALRCFYRNCHNVIDFGLLMEKAQPREGMWELGVRPEGDPERERVYGIVRAELDNTQRLIRLLEQGPDDLVVKAERPEDEDTFLLGPDLIEQLQKKRRITLAHWRDFDRIFLPPHI